MRRNPARWARSDMERIAERAALTPSAQAAGSALPAPAQKAAYVDPVTGTLREYGRLGVTTLGTPFRLSGV